MGAKEGISVKQWRWLSVNFDPLDQRAYGAALGRSVISGLKDRPIRLRLFPELRDERATYGE